MDSYESVRLVAGGFRIYKSSRLENESGVMRAHYASRGVDITRSLKTAIDQPNQRNNAKVSIADQGGCCRGRNGYMIGATYRPRDAGEVEDFGRARYMFVTDEDDIESDSPEGYGQSDNYAGCVQLYQEVNAVYEHVTDVAALSGDNIALASSDFQRRHVIVVTMEGVAPGTTFELEIIRRFEGIPTEDSMTFQRSSVVLSSQYSNALDILRRMPVSQIIRGGQNTFDDLGMVEMHGLWNLPVFQKAKDLVNLGLQHIQGNQDLKTKLIEAAPALVSYVAKKIPLLDLAEPELRDLAKDMATRLLESGTE